MNLRICKLLDGKDKTPNEKNSIANLKKKENLTYTTKLLSN